MDSTSGDKTAVERNNELQKLFDQALKSLLEKHQRLSGLPSNSEIWEDFFGNDIRTLEKIQVMIHKNFDQIEKQKKKPKRSFLDKIKGLSWLTPAITFFFEKCSFGG